MTVTAERTLIGPAPADDTGPPERSRLVDVDGAELHVRCWIDPDRSAEDPVVLVHGLGVASRMCRPAAERLALRRPVYAPDLPGFGRSEPPGSVLDPVEHADVLARWMDATGIGPAVIVGTSLGAQVAAELGRRHPEQCRAVVLASPTVEDRRRRWIAQIPRWQLEQSMQSLRLRAVMLADYLHCGVARVVRTFELAMQHRVEDTVRTISKPVLVCWGSRDPLLSRRWVEELARRAPDGELRVLPGAEHAMSHESPLELARAVEHFLAELGDPGDQAGTGRVRGRGTMHEVHEVHELGVVELAPGPATSPDEEQAVALMHIFAEMHSFEFRERPAQEED